MALIKTIDPAEATGKVAEIYQGMMNALGFIPNAFRIYSPSEHLLVGQTGNLAYFMRHKSLSGKFLALTRLLVSEQEKCAYCIGVNTGILMQYGILPDQAAEIRQHPEKAPLDDKEMALLLFVLKVVKDSNSTEKADVERLKHLGWSDADILEATFHATSQVAADMVFNAFKIESDR